MPWYTLGKNPADHRLVPAPPVGPETNTTYAGSSSLSEPRPYVSHEPKLGRPPRPKPVCRTAGSVAVSAWTTRCAPGASSAKA